MKKITPGKVFVWASSLVTVLWILAMTGLLHTTMEELTALFTGLGFVGLIATFMHDRQESADQEKEHRETLAEMKRQAEASAAAATELRRQAEASANAAFVSALATKIEVATAMANETSLHGPPHLHQSFLNARTQSLQELEVALQHLRAVAPA